MTEPVRNDLGELVCRYATMCCDDHLKHPAISTGSQGLHVVMQESSKWLLRLPLRMLRGELFDAVEGESKFGVHRLLCPQRAVVVDGYDAICWRNEIGATLLGYASYKISNCLLGLTVVPRRKRIGCILRNCSPDGCKQET